jgi:hypothetical protein
MGRSDRDDMAPGDEIPPEQPPAGEEQCPDCGGTGRAGEAECRSAAARGG